MTNAEQRQLRAEFPEAPQWLFARGMTLAEARRLMQLRRTAFPATADLVAAESARRRSRFTVAKEDDGCADE